MVLCASNPLSTQDDVAAALVNEYQIPVFAVRGEDDECYYRHIHRALDHNPVITLDDGADLVSEMHQHRRELLANILGSTEETATGDKHVLDHSHFEVMKDGCVIANSGHFNVEINIPAPEQRSYLASWREGT